MLDVWNFLGILSRTMRLKPAVSVALRPVCQSEMLHIFCSLSFAGFWFWFLVGHVGLEVQNKLDGWNRNKLRSSAM